MAPPATPNLVSVASGRVGILGSQVLEAVGVAVGARVVTVSGVIPIGSLGPGVVSNVAPLTVTLPGVGSILRLSGINGPLSSYWDEILTAGLTSYYAARVVVGASTSVGTGMIVGVSTAPLNLASVWRARGWTPGREVSALESAIDALTRSVRGSVIATGAGVTLGAGTWTGTIA